MGDLILEHVSKSFLRTDGTEITDAVDDICLTVHEGEFVSIVGASGCGKSTILRMIAGLIPPTLGTLTLNGKVLDGPSPSRGMVFQKPTLFPWLTVEKNVSFSLRMQHKYRGNESKVQDLLEMVGLTAFKNDYPHQLSGGMAQRVALIRTLINNPAIMLLDEPLGALDAFTRMNMQDEILKIWQKEHNTIVMVTHDVDEAIYMGTRVLVMEPHPGRIRCDLPITLPYPRNRIGRQFIGYRSQIIEMLNLGLSEA